MLCLKIAVLFGYSQVLFFFFSFQRYNVLVHFKFNSTEKVALVD